LGYTQKMNTKKNFNSKTRRVLLLTLALVMTLTLLVGCGGGKQKASLTINDDTFLVGAEDLDKLVMSPQTLKQIASMLSSVYSETLDSRELLVAANWKRFSRSKTRAIYYEPIRLAFFCMSRASSFGKLIRKIEACYDKDGFDKKAYVGSVCGAYRNREIMPKVVVAETVDLPFEDGVFKCPKDYDTYLTRIYGDYMKLPPEEKRITHHTFDAYYKNES